MKLSQMTELGAAQTYVASMRVNPDFSAATRALTREGRKELAYNAQLTAENAVGGALTPKLDALKAAGLIRGYEFIHGTGALTIDVVSGPKSAAVVQSLSGLRELDRLTPDQKVVQLDDMSYAPAAAVAKAEGPTVEWNVDKIGAQAAWAKGARGQGVTVGIVDTGANVQHEALKAHYRGTQADGSFNSDYNFFDAVNGKKDAYDDHSHGSHVAGTSVGGTADRLTGMAPDAKFISAKVFTASGGGNLAAILKGLSWMMAPTKADGTGADPSKAPDLVSNSWGNGNGASADFMDAWKAFDAAGITQVVAAGNAGPRVNTIGSPGSYASSITIGATDSKDTVASFSSRGPSKLKDADGNFIKKPDVSAPGVDVVSAGAKGDQYVRMSGTSMATPAVAGVVALMLSKNPNLTTEQIRQALMTSSKDIDAEGWDVNTGAGRVDAAAAVDAVS